MSVLKFHIITMLDLWILTDCYNWRFICGKTVGFHIDTLDFTSITTPSDLLVRWRKKGI